MDSHFFTTCDLVDVQMPLVRATHPCGHDQNLLIKGLPDTVLNRLVVETADGLTDEIVCF